MLINLISKGLSPESSIGFACFGLLLAKQGDIKLGYRLALPEKSLLDKFPNTKEVEGEVLLVIAEMQCFTEPLQATQELRIQGESASISAGDIHFACINRNRYCVYLFHGGENL